jgi:hypothetical protein
MLFFHTKEIVECNFEKNELVASLYEFVRKSTGLQAGQFGLWWAEEMRGEEQLRVIPFEHSDYTLIHKFGLASKSSDPPLIVVMSTVALPLQQAGEDYILPRVEDPHQVREFAHPLRKTLVVFLKHFQGEEFELVGPLMLSLTVRYRELADIAARLLGLGPGLWMAVEESLSSIRLVEDMDLPVHPINLMNNL